jgi:L-ascorbate metabolism protein UlaG (beta-lactamase superfamily)
VGVPVQEFDWWQGRPFGELQLHFVPAQHNAGRALDDRNRRLWGGWVVEYGARRFYFAGDTAYVQQLFTDIRARFGPIDMAALPIGAYLPRALMRHEHLDPADAVQAFADLGARQAFGVHWGTFQLGDEEPYQAACDLAAALADSGLRGFGLLPIGAFADIGDDAAAAAVPPALQMLPARASQPWRAQQPPAPGPATVVAR